MLKYKKVLVDGLGFAVKSYSYSDHYGMYLVNDYTTKRNGSDFTNVDKAVIENLCEFQDLHEEKVLMLEDTLTDKEKEQLNKTLRRVL